VQETVVPRAGVLQQKCGGKIETGQYELKRRKERRKRTKSWKFLHVPKKRKLLKLHLQPLP